MFHPSKNQTILSFLWVCNVNSHIKRKSGLRKNVVMRISDLKRELITGHRELYI